MPSLAPRAIAFAACVAALGILGTWLGHSAGLAWRIAAACLVGGLLLEYASVNRRRLRVRLAQAAVLRLGVRTRLKLAFENAGRRLVLEYVPALPPPLRGRGESRRLVLAAGRTQIDEIPVLGTMLGVADWDRIPARVRGPLGLAWWPRRMHLSARISVQPDSLRGRRPTVMTTARGRESRAHIGAGMELHHLRPYRQGDSRHAIDWKATARSGDLVTRVFSEDQHLEIVLAIDAGRTSRLEMDGMLQLSHYVNLAARLAEYAVLAEDRAGLLVFADRTLHAVPPQRGIPGVRRLRASLSDLEPRLVESNLIEAAFAILRLVRHRALVVLLTSLDDRSTRGQLARCVRMLSPKHLPLVVGVMSEEVATLAEQPAAHWLDPYRRLAAQEYRRDLAANASGLAAIGAIALAVRPAELESQVFGQYLRLRDRHRI